MVCYALDVIHKVYAQFLTTLSNLAYLQEKLFLYREIEMRKIAHFCTIY
jgi:hypothetical protein